MSGALVRIDPVLTQLEAACRSLSKARTIQDAKRVVDLASAAKVYARQQGLGQEAVNIANAVKIEALRRVGELIAAQKVTVGLAKGGGDGSNQHRKGATASKKVAVAPVPTLKEAGIDHKLSAQSQKLAALPAKEFEQVRESKASLTKVLREIRARETAIRRAPQTEKYRILYADPPWSYGNSGIINPDADNHGRAARHYPSMTITELCALPVKKLRDQDAVLFLWVTSPLLAECFAVIEAWGFTYKTSFVWDKVKHNFGHYNSVRHEFLLVCTHGACTPDVKTLHHSVQTIERSKAHSEKPEGFRTIIDELYPRGARLELFARRPAPGSWHTWGNEIAEATA